MKKFRLIALDIDGTLLDDDKEIPPENLEALGAAREAGVEVAISSGRMIPSIEPVEERLGIDTAIIAYNGGKVVGPRSAGRPVIDHRPVDAGVAAELLRFARQSDLTLNFYLDDCLYAEPGGEARRRLTDLYRARTGSVYHFTDLEPLVGEAPTKLILLAEPELRDRLHDRFRRELAGRVEVSKSEPEYLEITAPGVDKGAALGALARHLGIGAEEVLAVGDADNDDSMLRAAGMGVAVANARPSTRRAADFITERTNNEGAVAEAVRRFVLAQC